MFSILTANQLPILGGWFFAYHGTQQFWHRQFKTLRQPKVPHVPYTYDVRQLNSGVPRSRPRNAGAIHGVWGSATASKHAYTRDSVYRHACLPHGCDIEKGAEFDAVIGLKTHHVDTA